MPARVPIMLSISISRAVAVARPAGGPGAPAARPAAGRPGGLVFKNSCAFWPAHPSPFPRSRDLLARPGIMNRPGPADPVFSFPSQIHGSAFFRSLSVFGRRSFCQYIYQDYGGKEDYVRVMLRRKPSDSTGATFDLSQTIRSVLVSSKDFFLGAISGGAASLIVFPIDLAKTRIQDQKVVPGTARVYTNALQTILKVATSEGIPSLYSGVTPVLIGAAPEAALAIGMNDKAKAYFARYPLLLADFAESS